MVTVKNTFNIRIRFMVLFKSLVLGFRSFLVSIIPNYFLSATLQLCVNWDPLK